MRRTGIIGLFILGVLAAQVQAQPPTFTTVKDLQKEWLVFHENSYQKYEQQPADAIYFNLGASGQGHWLLIRSGKPFDVFLNQRWVQQKDLGAVCWNVDSLIGGYSSPLLVGVFQKDGIQFLKTTLVDKDVSPSLAGQERMPRSGDFFLNFAQLATLFLSIYFVLLFRTNPRLTLDYLNVSKLLSIHEREETLLATRVASSVNLLFYIFCSAFCALALLTIFHFGEDQIWVAHYFSIHSTADGFLQWIKLSAVILGWMALKLVIIYIFSGLFNLKDTSAIQYFSFIRMLFVVIGLITIICMAYFVYYGYPIGPHSSLLKASVLIMVFSVIMIFLKLLSFAPFSFFHLFSYLCASEIIPLVILLKVLLY